MEHSKLVIYWLTRCPKRPCPFYRLGIDIYEFLDNEETLSTLVFRPKFFFSFFLFIFILFYIKHVLDEK
jgi:hypothetical protein